MDPVTLALLGAGASGIGSAIGGYFGAESEAEQNQKMLEAIMSGSAEAETMLQEMAAQRGQTVEDLYAGLTGDFAGNQQDYLNQLQNTDMTQYNVDPMGDFNYDLNQETQNLLNPELDAILAGQTQALEGSAAGAGKLFSGETGRAIADNAAGTIAQEYGRAQGVALNNVGQKYGAFRDKADSIIRAAQVNSGNAQQNLNNIGTGYNAQAGQYNQFAGQKLAGQDALSSALANLKGQTIQAQAGMAGNSGGSAMGSAMGAIPGAINSFSSIYGALK